MDSSNGGGEAPQVLPSEAAEILSEGISLVLSRWTALQMAVENQWGGRESRGKADLLVASIQSWFAQTKPPLYIDDLEGIIYDDMLHSFNTEIEDGSVEEVAEQLMIMHEECLKGQYESIQKLKQSAPQSNAVSQSKQVANDEDDERSDEEGSEDSMAVEEARQEGMDVDQSKTVAKPQPDPEGWTVVANKRNKGRRSN
ncbi:Pre-rRNA-processing protein TSR2 [Rhynchospora pubera]|uniref:Pre-rRNA-processing protein TSR2 n=1 Tax=Rhynchospora pubera TaxID=906938 RepID=A0AAV8GSA9_9POAL|nr:Pre-rRNA-processing protein TSR2 [Rhynchospora pubera]